MTERYYGGEVWGEVGAKNDNNKKAWDSSNYSLYSVIYATWLPGSLWVSSM
jgi:hypothetical protein